MRLYITSDCIKCGVVVLSYHFIKHQSLIIMYGMWLRGLDGTFWEKIMQRVKNDASEDQKLMITFLALY